jgi:hypothetical protein
MSMTLSWLTKRGFLRVAALASVLGFLLFAAVGSMAVGFTQSGPGSDAKGASSPIFGVKIPDGYRRWETVAVSQGPKELKSILGNAVAMKAYRDGKKAFPDGSILVKLSWKREALEGFEGDFVPGAATMVQIMVKDAKKYASTGGWGFGRFIDGKPADAAQHKSCFPCHSSTKEVIEQDFVFTRFAP